MLLGSVARLMVAVLLATQLCPTFAWEAATASGSADTAVSLPGHGAHGGAPEHHNGSPQDNHGCAGHVFGHLVAATGVAVSAGSMSTTQHALAPGRDSFASAFLAFPDRPPEPFVPV